MATLLDGRALAARLKEQLKNEVANLKRTTGRVPVLRNVIVGEEHGSSTYANSQKKMAAQIGIDYDLVHLPLNTSQAEFGHYIEQLNKDTHVNGIMVHKPLPEHIKYQEVANYVDINKDVEGINVTNIGKLILGETHMIPCTPASVMEHVKSTGVSIRGKEVVIIGHSVIVGKPLSLLFLREMATVTICHVATSEAGNLPAHVGRADILVVAVGRAELVKGEWIKPGAIVIDVGINQVGDKIVGDVEFETAKERASYITPVPGGVGPVTVVLLMRNGIEAFKMQTLGTK